MRNAVMRFAGPKPDHVRMPMHATSLTRFVLLAVAGAAAGTFLMWLRSAPPKESTQMDDTLADSFPASDPPSWTSTTGVAVTRH